VCALLSTSCNFYEWYHAVASSFSPFCASKFADGRMKNRSITSFGEGFGTGAFTVTVEVKSTASENTMG
jgi:hypothetical protein